MKKLISLVLAIALLFLLVSVSLAAVTVGGNLRVWYQAADDETLTDNSYNGTFRFDYLSVTVNADLSPTSGVSGDFRFYQVDKNSASGADIRLNTAYYYQKDIFSKGDEFDLGYIKLPFYNETYKGLFVGSLAYTARAKNDVGISYAGKINTFTYALALANAANQANYNSPDNTDGVDAAVRLSYAPVQPLKIGLGYTNDVTNNDNSTTRSELDVTYGIGPFDILAEYVAVTPQSKDTLSGVYFEGSYQITDPLIVYAGRAVSISDGGDNGKNLTNYVNSSVTGGPQGKSFTLTDDWTIVGVKYLLTSKVTLQGEFLQQDSDKTKQIVGLRAIFSF